VLAFVDIKPVFSFDACSAQHNYGCDLALYFFGFRLTIQNTANRHVSNAFDLIAVFISFPWHAAAAAAAR
jgi:hypothetical protein